MKFKRMDCGIRRNDGVQWITACATMTVLMVNGLRRNDGISLNYGRRSMTILVGMKKPSTLRGYIFE